MTDWHPIDTAPRDGRAIEIRRVFGERIVHQSFATWRTIALPPILGEDSANALVAPAIVVTGWAYSDADYFVPSPTHWRE
jgi:hypothetical protein